MAQVYGAKSDDKTKYRPVDLYVTSWGTDPLFRGAYSFYPVKAFANVEYKDLK